jgi:hypothetical protein
MLNITAEEYKEAVACAKVFLAFPDEKPSLAIQVARVLLALAAYLDETIRKEHESGDVWGCSDIAAECGLEVKP